MNILITGAAGRVGKAAVELLAAKGHGVRVIGRREGLTVPRADYRSCDITDFQALEKQIEGMDAVVHLAALAGPSLATPEIVFEINCQGTFNVYQAAAAAGIKRVVNASSINALGSGFGVRDWPTHYFPIDEEHPTFTTDAYSFSKTVVEDIAAYHWRRDGISGTSLRLPAVVAAESNEGVQLKEYIRRCRETFGELMDMPVAGRRSTVDGWMTRIIEIREHRYMENPPENWKGPFPGNPLMAMRSDFWTAVDERDSAQAIEKSVIGDYEGSHVLFINDRVNRTGLPSQELLELFYPGAHLKRPLSGPEVLVSIDRARALLGYEPDYSVDRYF